MNIICHCGNNIVGGYINMQTCMCCRIKQKDLLHYKLSCPIFRKSVSKEDMMTSGIHDSHTTNKEFVFCHKCSSFVHRAITEHMIKNNIVPLIDRNYDTMKIYPCYIPRKNGSFSLGRILSDKNNPPILVDGGIFVYVEFESDFRLMKKYIRFIDILICNPSFVSFLRQEYFRINFEYEFVQNYWQKYTDIIKNEASFIYRIINPAF